MAKVDRDPVSPGKDPGRGRAYLCVAVSGAGSAVAGKPLTFECEKGALFARPDTGLSVWTVPYRADGAADLVPADIVIVRR